MKKIPDFLLALLCTVAVLTTAACSKESPRTLVTIADARIHTATMIDTGEPGDSIGDLLVFDQPLLNENMEDIGINSGTCIRTRTGHSFQCQWTLTMQEGNIQVAGREFDEGSSLITITGGTGQYTGINGQMESINNGDGTFTQTLRYHLP